MLSHGQRPRKQLGHHIAIIEFAQKNLSGCPATTFILFDRMRRKRNDAFYDVAIYQCYRCPGSSFNRRAISCGLLRVISKKEFREPALRLPPHSQKRPLSRLCLSIQ